MLRCRARPSRHTCMRNHSRRRQRQKHSGIQEQRQKCRRPTIHGQDCRFWRRRDGHFRPAREHAPNGHSYLSSSRGGQHTTTVPDGLKKTDIYSFGMLVWSTLIDGKDLARELELDDRPLAVADNELRALKQSDELLVKAVTSVSSYASINSLCSEAVDLVLYVLEQTIQSSPVRRHLSHAQAALRGMKLNNIDRFLLEIDEENIRCGEEERSRAPGVRGLTADSFGFYSGRLGDDYDVQQNKPGYRPQMSHPAAEEFKFEPKRLKALLDWPQQQQIVQELEQAARGFRSGSDAATDVQPWKAAYFLFQCYLLEFGVIFDAAKACHWLYQASNGPDSADVDYFAGAWLWRVCTSLGSPLSLGQQELLDYMLMGTLRGHRNCLEDGRTIASTLPNPADRRNWEEKLQRADYLWRTMTGGTGMAVFVERNMFRVYNLDDLAQFDEQIEQQLGAQYSDARRQNPIGSSTGRHSVSERLQNGPNSTSPFDNIYINQRGHGILHYAAASGKLNALKHAIANYQCNIDIPNQSFHETPLVCACRSGHFDCADFLLDMGANPNGAELGLQTPLHWLCSFAPENMDPLAKKLLAKAPKLEKSSQSLRKDKTAINADWENILNINVTPLGRAVLMKSLRAVEVLLDLGADPFTSNTGEFKTPSAI